MIVVIDYGMGNLCSVLHKIKKLRVEAVLSSDPSEIESADKLILPGVGSFKKGMENIRDEGLFDVLNKKVVSDKTPILGICLGMQLFTQKSEEGGVDGLAWVPAETRKFNFNGKKLRIPHVGWNTLVSRKESPLFEAIPDDMRFYFTHSYHVCCENDDIVLAKTNYGYDFTSMIQKDNIVGVQFHPEKSHLKGIKIIENFIKHF